MLCGTDCLYQKFSGYPIVCTLYIRHKIIPCLGCPAHDADVRRSPWGARVTSRETGAPSGLLSCSMLMARSFGQPSLVLLRRSFLLPSTIADVDYI